VSLKEKPIILRLPAEGESVTTARHAITDVLPRGTDAFAVQTVVSELVGNVVVHAYPEAEGSLLVFARVERGILVVAVADGGVGMRPRLDSPGLGLGIPLAGKLARDLRFEANAQGTTIAASFETADSQPPADVVRGRAAEEAIDEVAEGAMAEARRLLDRSSHPAQARSRAAGDARHAGAV
jgi:anti-sigma regulatory factor (Ser/Thr protein kinase)